MSGNFHVCKFSRLNVQTSSVHVCWSGMSRVLNRVSVEDDQRPATLASVVEKSLWWKETTSGARRDDDELSSFCERTLTVKHDVVNPPCAGDQVFIAEGTPLEVVLDRLIEVGFRVC